MSEPAEFIVEALEARVFHGERGVVFIFPRIAGRAAVKSIQVFSVEIDRLELLPSTKIAVEAGAGSFELPPVRIVNPSGVYRLGVKVHPDAGEEVEYAYELEF